jgi:hypothetical protein
MRLLAEHDHTTVVRVCKLFGVTKQAWYKYDDHSLEKASREELVIHYVKEIRSKDPAWAERNYGRCTGYDTALRELLVGTVLKVS